MNKELFHSENISKAWEEFSRRVEPLAIPDGTGGVNPGDRRALFYLAYGKAKVLEIGTHIGASLVHLAAAAGHVTTVDIKNCNGLPGRGLNHTPSGLAEALGLTSKIDFVVSPAEEFLEKLRGSFDMIFLDGSHAAEAVCLELPRALKRLTPGGFVVLHDYFPGLQPLWSNNKVIPGPYQAVAQLQAAGLEINIQPLGALPWPTKCGSNVTSLAVASVCRRPS